MKSVSPQRLLLRAGTWTCQAVNHVWNKQTRSAAALCQIKVETNIVEKKRVNWVKGKCKNGNKSCVSAHFASGWVWWILLLPLLWFLQLITCWLKVSPEVFCLHKSNSDSHTPAERSSSQHPLQDHETSFFSLLAEKRKVKNTSRCWKIYCKASFRRKCFEMLCEMEAFGLF